MDKQQDRKNPSEEARLKRKLILHKKGLNIYRRSNNHFSKPAMYIDIGRQSMTNGTPLSDISKDQETSFPNHNISTARFGQPSNSDNSKDQETSFPNYNISTARFGQSLNSGRHIIREKHYVSPGTPGIHTTHLEVVKGKHSKSDEKDLSKNDHRENIGLLNTGSKACSVIAMKNSFPWNGQVLDPSHNSTSSGVIANPIPNLPTMQIQLPNPSIDINSQDVLIRRASMYQDYMEQIPIPSQRGSIIPFTTWMGLGRSIKKLYGQPLHYLTNIRLTQWDKLRIGSEDEYKPLDEIIHPCKAEATIWLMEQVHRQTSSHFHIANSWKMDPMYNGSVDSIFPALEHTHHESI